MSRQKTHFEELKTKSAEELEHMIRAGKERLRSLSFDLAAGKVKNVAELTKVKRSIAQMYTLLKVLNKKPS